MINTLFNRAETASKELIAFKIGMRLSVCLNGSSLNQQYLSRVEGVNSKEIQISMPMNRGVILPLVIGTDIFFSYVINNTRYAFKSAVLHFAKSSVNIAVIRYPEEVYEVDFRNSFRVPIDQLIKINTISTAKIDTMSCESSPTFYANCIDLSSEGAMVATRSDLTKYIELYLDISSLVNGLGLIGSTVVWHDKIDEFYHFGVSFFGMRSVDKDTITKFLFKKQTELRRISKRGL